MPRGMFVVSVAGKRESACGNDVKDLRDLVSFSAKTLILFGRNLQIATKYQEDSVSQ
jgi:hypothetical protein